MRRWAFLAVALCAGCGGGGGGSSPSAPAPVNVPIVTQQSAGGMWFALPTPGTSGAAASLMIAETGDLKITMPATATSGAAFGHGAVTVVGSSLQGSFETRAIPSGPIGSVGAMLRCTVSGTVTTRIALQLTSDCTDGAGVTTTTSLSFLYDARYETDSSLADIAGNYTLSVSSTTNSLNINGDGTLFGMYANGPRCTINGTVSIIDPNFNLYRFEVRFSSCTFLAQQYEGVTMTGLATRNLPGQKPGAFLLIMTAVINGRLEFASVLYEPV